MAVAAAVVIGIGNSLVGDDGAGLAAIRLLRRQPLPADVELVEAGVPDVDLLAVLEGREVAVLVDALQADLLPGTVKTFTMDDLPPTTALPWSLHGFGLAELLRLGYLVQPEKMPRRLWLVGIQAGRLRPGEEALSPAVAAALPEAVRVVRQLLAGAHV
ncbi:MAG: hydrogenase maturation protease [Clostridia bacterium]|nr:hydrogenase maturation protease [Clostridia bacterium]